LDCCPGLSCNIRVTWTDPETGIEELIGKHCGEGEPIVEESWGSYPAGTCVQNLVVSFQTQTHTPLATETWAKLVSGPYSAFRRIFPKIEDSEGRPIRKLWDIPTETDVRFIVSPPFSIVGGSTHQIYFPHIGGIHEYFLNCLQKTLRPQGFGQGCISAPDLSPNTQGGGQTYWCPTPAPPPPPAPAPLPTGPVSSSCFITNDFGGMLYVYIQGGTMYVNNMTDCTLIHLQPDSDCNLPFLCPYNSIAPYQSTNLCNGYFTGHGTCFFYGQWDDHCVMGGGPGGNSGCVLSW